MPCCLLVGGQRRQFKLFRADDAGASSACQSAASHAGHAAVARIATLIEQRCALTIGRINLSA
jgi:hypothetical protein